MRKLTYFQPGFVRKKFQHQTIEPFAIKELTVVRFVIQPLRCSPLGAAPRHTHTPSTACAQHTCWRGCAKCLSPVTRDLGRLYSSGQE